MANEKTERVDWEAAFAAVVALAYVAQIEDKAVIRKDPAKGIAENVEVPFTKPVFNVENDEQAADLYKTIGTAAFNGLLNYASDLKCRGAVAQVKRAELTADPLKKEVSTLAKQGFDEVSQTKYVEYRNSGLSLKQALAKLLTE